MVKVAATGKQSGVGEISAEFKITDAMTGQLIAAALDRRVGGKRIYYALEHWNNANQGLKYWAQQTRFALCTGAQGHRLRETRELKRRVISWSSVPALP